MNVGQYGQFNGVWYIVVEVRGDKLLLINEAGTKKQVASKNFVPRVGNVARTVYFNGTSYLVTKNQQIISLASGKFMRWHQEHGVRKAILNLRGVEQAKEVLRNTQIKLPL